MSGQGAGVAWELAFAVGEQVDKQHGVLLVQNEDTAVQKEELAILVELF